MTVQDIHYELIEGPRPPHGVVRRVVAAIAAWRTRLRQQSALAQMSDHMLRDLGLTDADIWREIRRSPWHT
jgi:uncharacterized protein YjiS (DUF1127 family)